MYVALVMPDVYLCMYIYICPIMSLGLPVSLAL